MSRNVPKAVDRALGSPSATEREVPMLDGVVPRVLEAAAAVDGHDRLVAVTPGLCDTTGHTPEQLTAMTVDQLAFGDPACEVPGLRASRDVGRARSARSLWSIPLDHDGARRHPAAAPAHARAVSLLVALDTSGCAPTDPEPSAHPEFDAHDVGVLVTDLDGIVWSANRQAAAALDRGGFRLAGTRFAAAVDGREWADVSKAILAKVVSSDGFATELVVRADKPLTIQLAAGPLLDATGRPAAALMAIRRAGSARSLLQRRARQQQILAQLARLDRSGASPRRLAARAAHELRALFKNESIQVRIPDPARDEQRPSRPSPAGVDVVRVPTTTTLPGGDGPLDETDHDFMHTVMGIVQAAVRHQGVRDHVERLRTHDRVSGLPNRRLFLDRLEQVRAAADRSGGRFAVLLLDVDNFKSVNDGLGHAAGDQVLAQIAEQLEDALRSADTLACFGSDQFVALCPDIPDDTTAFAIGERLREALERTCHADHPPLHLTASVGMVLGDGKSDAEALLRDVDTAMNVAKSRGRNRTEAFDERMGQQARQQFEMTRSVADAVTSGRVEVVFQPIVELATGAVVGAEALARLRMAGGHNIAPAQFIGVAEQAGLIGELGRQVLQRACRAARDWIVAAPNFLLSVNLAPHQLAEPELVATIEEVLTASGMDPRSLCLEVTESARLARTPIREVMGQLQQVGIRLAIDDFGTGYSSLAQLRHMPIDLLKIDASFVRGVVDDPHDLALVDAAIRLAGTFGLTAVAEGVETTAQRAQLTELGCDLAQGFLWTPPVPADEFATIMAAQQPVDPCDQR